MLCLTQQMATMPNSWARMELGLQVFFQVSNMNAGPKALKLSSTLARTWVERGPAKT